MSREKILIIDDEPDMTMLISTILEFNDYHVTVINDPMVVIPTLEKEKFDLICTDIIMPNLDGLELIKRLKQNKKTENVKIIAISAKDFTPSEYDFLVQHKILLIKKPYTPSDLINKINQQLKI